MDARRLGSRIAAPLLLVSLLGCRSDREPTPVCTFTIAPANHTAPADGATRTVNVSASAAGCAWSASATQPWIMLQAAAMGTGSGAFDYVVAANPTTDARSGTIQVAGLTHGVVQDGRPPEPPPCVYEIVPESADVDSAGGMVSVRVETTSACPWSAVAHASWLTFDASPVGTGAGSFEVRAAAHAGAEARVGTVTVADRTFTLRQHGFDAASCNYTVTPVLFTPCLSAGSATTRIETADRCPWSVASTAPWLTIDGAAAGAGSSSIRAVFGSNYAAPREGILEVRWPAPTAGQNVRVAQAGCSYGTSATSFAVGASGGSLSFTVIQQTVPNNCGGPLQDACIWSATTGVAWITIVTSMPQQGDQPVAFTVAPNNTGQSRTGAIAVQDRTVAVTQAP